MLKQAMRVTMSVLLIGVMNCHGAPPPDANVEKTIREYFRSRGYHVLELRMDTVGRNPLRERDYMAPLTFVVPITRITLEKNQDGGETATQPSSGTKVFLNAVIHIQRGTLPEQPWEVARVEGIDIL